MDLQSVREGVVSGMRLLMTFAPHRFQPITAFLAQTWAEYSAFKQEANIEDFLASLRDELERQRAQIEKLESQKIQVDKVFDNLLMVTQKVMTEPNAEKRKVFAKFFVNGILEPMIFEEQRFLLEILNELLISELIILGLISSKVKATVNTITNAMHDGKEYVSASFARLESKGLIELSEEAHPQGFQIRSYDQSGREKIEVLKTWYWYEVSQVGKKLLATLK